MPHEYDDEDDDRRYDDRRRPERSGRGGGREDDGYDIVDDDDDDRGRGRGSRRGDRDRDDDRPRRRSIGPVPNYLLQSILVTLCCCMPLGVVAIVYAAQVDGKLRDGDEQGALYASRNASKWAWIAFVCGIIANIAGFILGIAGGVLEEVNRSQPY